MTNRNPFNQCIWVANAYWNDAERALDEATRIARVAAEVLKETNRRGEDNTRAADEAQTAVEWMSSRTRIAQEANNAVRLAGQVTKLSEESAADGTVLRKLIKEAAARELPGATTLLQQLTLVNEEWGT